MPTDLPSEKRPTIVDVAAAADVGASTVSRYVRGAKSVSAAVAARIEASIASLGYEPNVLARGLRNGRTRTLGVLFPHVANIFYANALKVIEAEAYRHGFTVLLLTHHEDQQLQEAQLVTLKQYHCDGIILIAAAVTSPSGIGKILGSTPLVALDRSLGPQWDSITLHNRRAGRQATEHLLSHKHRHFVAITAHHELGTLQSRLKGHVDALRTAGLAPRVLTMGNPDLLRNELLAELDRKRAPATAILSVSYSVTVGVLHALRSSGFSLRSKAFLGVDDLEFATLVDPPLTTLCQPAEELARLAVDRLFHRIAGSTVAIGHTKLNGELKLRESCGCPPGA